MTGGSEKRELLTGIRLTADFAQLPYSQIPATLHHLITWGVVVSRGHHRCASADESVQGAAAREATCEQRRAVGRHETATQPNGAEPLTEVACEGEALA